MFISLLGVSIIAFTIFQIVPGDPAKMMSGAAATPQDIENMRQIWGLDRPAYEQYLVWLSHLFQGDLGKSIRFKVPVLDLIFERLPATLELIIVSVLIASIIGVVLGVLSGARKGGFLDRIFTTVSFLGLAIPNFLWGLIFVIIFGAILKILPVSGRLEIGVDVAGITGFMLLDSILTLNINGFLVAIRHLILPSTALALGLIAIIQRTLASSMVDVMTKDYILTDRIKGISEKKIILVRALKNAFIPTLTIVGAQFAFLIGGSTLIELIFGWPGVGTLAFIAVQWKDIPVIQGIVFTYAMIVVFISLIIDLVYSFLNPKIRFG